MTGTALLVRLGMAKSKYLLNSIKSEKEIKTQEQLNVDDCRMLYSVLDKLSVQDVVTIYYNRCYCFSGI